ncbi:TetR/AcrR family transcriptional regulator [Flavobacterium aquicola]|uniref:TetR family transcriptional regulator n=1 Tax=Flavobacterium aquicola TaxID=1682742 RepID=A0A3E0EMT9_9FLAO|nr:TetR/AcrR family transcriptional regulator [Flavobacterium aquicola]REG99498.1 TetR family transcriptional regulator [Flavobacterium aquicola]
MNNYKKKKDPIESRKLILETAIELANTYELSQISFDALAKKCGLSKGGIIHHFPTKEAIFDTLFKENFEEYKIWVQEELNSEDLPNPAIALLRITLKKCNDESYRRLMKVIYKCLVNNEQYCQLWNEWFSEHIIKNLDEDSEIKTLLGSLVAIGIWNMNTLGLYKIETQKMNKILDVLPK